MNILLGLFEMLRSGVVLTVICSLSRGSYLPVYLAMIPLARVPCSTSQSRLSFSTISVQLIGSGLNSATLQLQV